MVFTMRQFSKPGCLEKLHPENLLALLSRYPDYFDGILSDFTIPDKITKDFNFAKLANAFANPVLDGDTKMFDDLVLIEEMSRDKYAPIIMEHLQTAAYRMDFEPEAQSLNNALLVFLNEPRQLNKFRQELQLENPKSFTVIHGVGKNSSFIYNESLTEILREQLDNIYAAKKYGRGVIVNHFHTEDGEYFLIRKGLHHTYQPTVGKDFSTVGIYYRPEVFDIVIFNPAKNELKMAFGGEQKWMKTTYPVIFGKVFFKKDDYFEISRKMSFATFQESGEAALTCLPEAPISSVTVSSIVVRKYGNKETLFEGQDRAVVLTQEYKLDDFFRNAPLFNLSLKDMGDVIGLKLIFHFGPKEKRTIILSEDKCTGLNLDHKGILIEAWLYEHGFIVA